MVTYYIGKRNRWVRFVLGLVGIRTACVQRSEAKNPSDMDVQEALEMANLSYLVKRFGWSLSRHLGGWFLLLRVPPFLVVLKGEKKAMPFWGGL